MTATNTLLRIVPSQNAEYFLEVTSLWYKSFLPRE